MEESKIKDTIDKLKNSIMFNISLSSQELFHSNLWAYILEKDKSNLFFKNLFNIKDQNKFNIKNVYREKYKIDVLIEAGDDYYLIENKIKSLPRKEQLDEYENKIKDKNKNQDKFKKGIITGFIKPNFINDDNKYNNWVFVSYKTIADILKKLLSQKEFIINFENDKVNDKVFLEQYIEMINNICEIIDHKVVKSDSLDIDITYIEKIRFGDVVKKLNGSKILEKLRNNFEEIMPKKINGFELEFNNFFFNKNTALDIRYVKNKNSVDEVVLAIQIEGNQYRKGASLIGKDITVKDVYQKFKEYDWFKDYIPDEHNQIFKKSTTMKKEYCKYENDKTNPYHFVYQYFNLSDNDKIFENIKKIIEDDLRLMKNIIENNFERY